MEKIQSQRNGDIKYIHELKKQVKQLQLFVVGLAILLAVAVFAICQATSLITKIL